MTQTVRSAVQALDRTQRVAFVNSVGPLGDITQPIPHIALHAASQESAFDASQAVVKEHPIDQE